MFSLIRKITTFPFIVLITIYQKTLSPDHSLLKSLHPHGFCRYYPTCSEYTKLSLKKRGVIIGLAKGFYRILRCNPWSKGGIDESY